MALRTGGGPSGPTAPSGAQLRLQDRKRGHRPGNHFEARKRPLGRLSRRHTSSDVGGPVRFAAWAADWWGNPTIGGEGHGSGKAQGSPENPRQRQRWCATSNSSAEQTPEVDGQGASPKPNGARGWTLVTGKPLPKRKHSEGPHTCEDGRLQAHVCCSAENQVNPMIGCGAQQTRKAASGENRRSREKRQGRNVSEELATLRPRETGSGRKQ